MKRTFFLTADQFYFSLEFKGKRHKWVLFKAYKMKSVRYVQYMHWWFSKICAGVLLEKLNNRFLLASMKSLANSENLLSVIFRDLIKNGDFKLKNAYKKPFMIWKLFPKTPLTSKFLRIFLASNERYTQEKSPPMTEEVIIRSVSESTFRISLYLHIA